MGDVRDIYLATIYISPSGNKEDVSKTFEKLGEEIGLFQRKGNIILQGDLNAHTNNKDDIITVDKFDQETGGHHLTLPHRNSIDTSKTDRRGKELLELCKALDILIINGRKTGDPFGNITSYQWNGKAVVDYVISSSEIFHNITYFKVGEYSPFISDHCPLTYEMHSKSHPRGKGEDNLRYTPTAFYMNNQDKCKFIEALKSPEIAQKLATLDASDSTDPQNFANEISNTLMEACSKAEIKVKKKPHKLGGNAPWFDKECEKLKKSIKRKCRDFRKKKM